MINNSYQNVKILIVNVLSKYILFQTLKECRKSFIVNAFTCFSSIKGKINFLQMERFSNKCEQYFKELTCYLVADSFFAKWEVVQTVTALGMHFISRLRDDAVLFYLNREPRQANGALFYKNGKEVVRKLYFSTDLKMDGMKIVLYYRSRFQIEFLYRDAKQHCGIEDCQARSKNKLHFHFNTALSNCYEINGPLFR